MILLLVPILSVMAAPAPVSTELWAWGNNFHGQLGNGTNTNSNIPVMISGLNDVKCVASSGSHTLIVKSDGTAWAWGSNNSGELGNGSNIDSNVPVQVIGLTDIIAVSAHSGSGANHSMALKSDGTVWGWGDNSDGQLGNDTREDKNIPVLISLVNDVIAIDAGDDNCMVLKSDGTIWGWGENHTHGKLGNGTNKDPPKGTIVQVTGINDAIAIDESTEHGLALRADGSVWAWGGNFDGQLGNLDDTDCYQPSRVLGLWDITSIATGDLHNLALKSDGTVWAWGSNYRGQLGIGTVSLPYNRVVQVEGLTDIIAIAAGGAQSLAVKSDGTVWVWGNNTNGQLGNGTNIDSNLPVQIPGLTNVTYISASGNQGFALVKKEPVPVLTETIAVPSTTLISSLTSTPISTSPSSTLTTTSDYNLTLSTTISSVIGPTSSAQVTEVSDENRISYWWIWLISGLTIVVVAITLIIRFKRRF